MSSRADRSSSEETITVFKSDGQIVARDESTGVSSFGESKIQALERLSEALELYEVPVTDDEEPEEDATAPWL